MEFRIKDLQSYIEIKPSQIKNIVELLNKKSFETNYQNGILEVDILPDRYPDASSLIGLAKEIALICDLKFKKPKIDLKTIKKSFKEYLTVKNQAQKGLINYFGRIILNVQNKPSPKWLKEFVEFYGFNPINFLVDLSNFVMIEYGAPLHILDLDKIEGKEITIRFSKEGEAINLLGGGSYLLPKNSLIITDKKTIIDLVGIKGGKKAEVDLKTRNILIQAPIVERIFVRRTSQKIGLKTEAVNRFEKFINQKRASLALDRLAYLIQKNLGGEIIQEKIQISPIPKPPLIFLTFEKINDYLGFNLKKTEIKKIIKSLEGKIIKESKRGLLILPPEERSDLEIEENIIDEIVRLIGYENLPVKFPPVIQTAKEEDQIRFKDLILKIATSLGFDQVINYEFESRKDLEIFNFPEEAGVEILNPLNPETQFFRHSLIPSLLKNAHLNQKHFKEFKLIEIGKIAFQENNKIEEKTKIGFLLAQPTNNEELFLSLKGVIEALIERLGIESYLRFVPLELKFSKISAKIILDEQEIGLILIPNKKVFLCYDLEIPLVIAEIDFRALLNYFKEWRIYQPIPQYPAVKRDISFIVDFSIPIDEIESTLEESSPYLEAVELFDYYQGPGLEENQKSLAFHLIFRAQQRTLTDEEVNQEMKKIENILKEKFKAQIR